MASGAKNPNTSSMSLQLAGWTNPSPCRNHVDVRPISRARHCPHGRRVRTKTASLGASNSSLASRARSTGQRCSGRSRKPSCPGSGGRCAAIRVSTSSVIQRLRCPPYCLAWQPCAATCRIQQVEMDEWRRCLPLGHPLHERRPGAGSVAESVYEDEVSGPVPAVVIVMRTPSGVSIAPTIEHGKRAMQGSATPPSDPLIPCLDSSRSASAQLRFSTTYR